MIPLFKVTMSPHVNEELEKVLHSGFIGQGKKVEEFEDLLSTHFGWNNVVAVNSGTSALQLALSLVKEEEGQVVLLPPLSCFATTSAVLANNMTPRWVDIDPATLTMSLDHLRSKLTEDTKIIIFVHFAGRMPNYRELDEILDEHEYHYGFRPIVIEDCAQSLGGFARAEDMFSIGAGVEDHIQCFSFQAVKTLTTGDGGAIVLPSEELYERAKLLRWYGYDREQNIENQSIVESGFKYHMNDINATIGICNLKYLIEEDLMYKQIDNYGLLLDELWINIHGLPCNGQFPIVTSQENIIDRLRTRGIESFPAHFRCDKHECVKHFRSALPGMDYVEPRMTMIPCGWWVEDHNMEEILSVITTLDKIPWHDEGF